MDAEIYKYLKILRGGNGVDLLANAILFKFRQQYNITASGLARPSQAASIDFSKFRALLRARRHRPLNSIGSPLDYPSQSRLR